MPSEIDDIFSGKVSKADIVSESFSKARKEKVKSSTSALTESASSIKKKSKKKKRKEGRVEDEIDDNDKIQDSVKAEKVNGKKKKRKHAEPDPTESGDKDVEVEKKQKRVRAVETVRDPSALVGSSKPSAPPPVPKANPKKSSSKRTERKEGDEDLSRFKDSRGTGPRKRTEEGFLVFKEDELGIQDSGGDTPLCPFDCDCCF